MKFSIITPSLNQGSFITDCIESVRTQLGDGFEVEHIVTDAGSTDETLEVLKKYPDINWVSEPDQGMSDGINKGFLKATGDWLMWLNCDDYLEPNALAKVADFISKHPDADVVHGDCIFVQEDQATIRRKYDTQVDAWDLLFLGCVIPSTSTFYRRAIVDAGHLLDVNYKNTMDLEYYLRLMHLGYRFSYLPEALAYFRLHDASTTNSNQERMVNESMRCRTFYIREKDMPSWISKAFSLKILHKIFKIRRVMKRLLIHGRII